MPKVEIDYHSLPNFQADEKAIADLKSYVSGPMFKSGTFKTIVQVMEGPDGCEAISFQLSMFMGIEGRPVWAMMRKYRLERWVQWCNEQHIAVDDYGYQI